MFDNTRFASITFQLLRLWHLEYSYFSINNDIAILRLSKDVTFNSNVVPACLPTNKVETYAGKDAVVSGWNQGALLQKTDSLFRQSMSLWNLDGRSSSFILIRPNCSCSGWGSIATGGKTSPVLKETTVKILKQSETPCANVSIWFFKYAHQTNYWLSIHNVKICRYGMPISSS